MGAWGTGLFSDDVACDIRIQFRALLDEGLTVPQATRRILDEWRPAVEDEEDGPVIWLALASLQWDRGALQPSVQKKATQILDRGVDLDRWRETGDPKTVRRREAVLRNLRRKLETPPPERKRLTVRRTAKSDRPNESVVPISWQVGQVVAYTLRSGDRILLHVVQCSNSRRQEDVKPTFAVLDWQGSEVPTVSQIMKIPYRKPPATTLAWGNAVADIGERRAYCIEVAHRSPANIPVRRLQLLPVSRKLPFDKPHGWNPGVLWRLLDAQLEQDLGLA